MIILYMLKDLKEGATSMWWLLVITSVASIVFGIATLFMPGVTLVSLIVLFALYLLVNGIVELIYGFNAVERDELWWLSTLIGVALIGVSVYLVKNPAINASVFVLMLGWILVIRGVYDITIGTFFAEHKVSWIISGILGIVTGIMIWVYPVSGSLAFVWVLGLYALINGAIVLSSALTVRSTYKKIMKSLA
jgi:uncharacterized membrane protein HdeD (DUF308 family)